MAKDKKTKRNYRFNGNRVFGEGIPRHLIINIIGTTLIFIALALVVIGIRSDTSAYNAKFSENETLITDLKADVKILETRDTYDVAYAKRALHSATEDGTKVAELQTRYQDYVELRDEDEIKAFDGVVADLSGYFPLDQQDGRVPWFVPSVDNSRGEWVFKNVYGFEQDSIDVVWIFVENEAQTMLAYTVGTYQPSTKLFSNIKTHLTGEGSRYVAATESGVEPGEVFQSLIDQVMKEFDNPSTPTDSTIPNPDVNTDTVDDSDGTISNTTDTTTDSDAGFDWDVDDGSGIDVSPDDADDGLGTTQPGFIEAEPGRDTDGDYDPNNPVTSEEEEDALRELYEQMDAERQKALEEIERGDSGD